MLEHDLQYPDMIRVNCGSCNFDTRHFNLGVEWWESTDGEMELPGLRLACRICEETTVVPTEFIGNAWGQGRFGDLSQLKIVK